MRDIRVQIKGPLHSARAIRTGQNLPVTRPGECAEFTLPALAQFELVELR